MYRRQTPRSARARGFTLVELLVVIGIIGLLVSIFLPVVGKARRQARVTACAANVRTLIQASTAYASQYRGEYPGLAMETGGNLFDVPKSFYKEVMKYGAVHDSFFCPAADNPEQMQVEFTRFSTFYMISYNIWIPRPSKANGTKIIPPALTSTEFTFPNPKPTTPIAGPARPSDRSVAGNPIITDRVGTKNVTPPADANIGVKDHPYDLDEFTSHQDERRVLSINAGFADGRVELIGGTAVRPRYFGNRWNWR